MVDRRRQKIQKIQKSQKKIFLIDVNCKSKALDGVDYKGFGRRQLF